MMITMYQSYSISKSKASVQRNKSEPQLTFLKCLHNTSFIPDKFCGVNLGFVYISILFHVRGMFLNLLICSTFCAFMHITLWPWNEQTGFLLEDMFLLVMGTEFSGPHQSQSKKNPLETYTAQTYVFSLTPFAPPIPSCQAVGCTSTHTHSVSSAHRSSSSAREAPPQLQE